MVCLKLKESVRPKIPSTADEQHQQRRDTGPERRAKAKHATATIIRFATNPPTHSFKRKMLHLFLWTLSYRMAQGFSRRRFDLLTFYPRTKCLPTQMLIRCTGLFIHERHTSCRSPAVNRVSVNGGIFLLESGAPEITPPSLNLCAWLHFVVIRSFVHDRVLLAQG